MKYEVSVTFRCEVPEKELTAAVKAASEAQIKGFGKGEISTHKSYEEEIGMVQPVRKVRRVGGKK